MGIIGIIGIKIEFLNEIKVLGIIGIIGIKIDFLNEIKVLGIIGIIGIKIDFLNEKKVRDYAMGLSGLSGLRNLDPVRDFVTKIRPWLRPSISARPIFD